jgi:hypothetical protein
VVAAMATPGDLNEYTGCSGLPADSGVSVLSVAATSGELFFKKHVATRTPVAFDGTVPQLAATKLWNDEYLVQRCSKCAVKVETREEGGSYGKGNETQTNFAEFIASVRKGNSYLTTQDLEYDEDGRPSIISPPLTELTSDFPLTLSLAHKLVPANINCWFGHTPSNQHTTSGLHHDFHDNIYVLLRGEKKITLFSPAEAGNLYTSGKISRVHPNGRINYEGQLQTRADGSDLQADAALQASLRLQKAAERLSKKEKPCCDAANNSGSGSEGECSEDELDRALEDVLDAEIGGEDDYCEDSDDMEEEDSDVDESEVGSGGSSDDVELGEESGSEEDSQLHKAKQLLGPALRAALTRGSAAGGSKRAASEETGGSGKRQRSGSNVLDGGPASSDSQLPANFSRVDTSLPPEQLRAQFPLYAQALERGAAVEVVLRAGQMLYIPAGWFHEVRSRSAPADPACPDYYEPGRGGHLALNYWFHPPDSDCFEQPYTSDFWRRDFEDRLTENAVESKLST